MPKEMVTKMARLDSSLEATGAEFLVLGELLVEGIQAYKSYTRWPGYDLIAANPATNRSCRIQVKSRWATDFDGSFLIRNFDCDFVVVVALNRGYRYRKKRAGKRGGRGEPQFYVLPIEVVRSARYARSKWGKVFLRKIPSVNQYIGNWELVKDYLCFNGRNRSTAKLMARSSRR